MAMTPDEQGIFYVLIVSGGPGAGEFVYDASGNLRSSNVGQATTDPVQGISCPQGFATYNGHGAVLNLLSTSATAAGFFQYFDNGSAVQGARILVITSTAGTDPVTGTAYNAGMTGIDPAFGDAIQTIGANISLSQLAYTRNANIAAAAGGGASQPRLQLDAPEQTTASHLQMWMAGASPDASKVAQFILAAVSGGGTLTPQTSALLEVQGSIAASLLKAIVSGALETWHAVGAGGQPPFLNSFSAGGSAPRFQLEPVNGGRVRLSGAVNTGAINPANTAMFTLPAGYRPARTLNFVTQNNITAYTLGSGSVQILATGDVTVVPATTAGKFVLLDGICFELD